MVKTKKRVSKKRSAPGTKKKGRKEVTFCPQNQKKRYSEVAELVFLDFATDLVLVFFFSGIRREWHLFFGARRAATHTFFKKKRSDQKKRCVWRKPKKEVDLFFWSGRKPKEKR